MDFEWIQDLTAGVRAITGLLSAVGVTALARQVRRLFVRWRTRRATDTFEIGFQCQAALQHLRMGLMSKRSMVLVAHNGGGEVSVQRPLYTSVRFQATEGYFPTANWTAEALDEGYWKVLREVNALAENGHFRLRTLQLQEGSKLRNLYEAQGIGGAYVFHLFSTPTEFWYVSTAYGKDHPEHPSEAEAAEIIRSAKAKLVRYLRDRKAS